jgi:hypothetical protein
MRRSKQHHLGPNRKEHTTTSRGPPAPYDVGLRRRSGAFLPPSPGREGPPARPDLMSATRWARTADFYDAMDRDIIYPNLGIY